MSRLLFATAVLAAFASVPSAAAPVPKHLFPKEPIYFPTEVGSEWVYDEGGFKYEYFVKSVEEKDGAKLVAVHLLHRDRKGSQHAYTVEVTKSGVREVSNANRKIEPPTPLVKSAAKKDDTWETMFKLNGEYRADYSFRCDGIEEVKVPAGTFHALRIEQRCEDPLTGKSYQTITTWFAPGIGPVKMQYAPNAIRELVSFSPGKGAPPKK